MATSKCFTVSLVLEKNINFDDFMCLDQAMAIVPWSLYVWILKSINDDDERREPG